ncbi:MAG: HEPN domain protein [Ignavibacteria bacterium]|nr:MAG: HEPN domain protein [Ignavibacteria bacterium]KAF0161028.1 MAG: HEPN domain protein [Ignavibacteria bacterium]
MNEINDLTKKSEKFLKTAKLVFDSEDYDSCVSRCYYAMFFMAEAALLSKGLKASSHKGVISLFGEHFVKSEIFERELGKALGDAYDKRLIGDYGVGFAVVEIEADDMLKTSQDFVKKLKNYLNKQ